MSKKPSLAAALQTYDRSPSSQPDLKPAPVAVAPRQNMKKESVLATPPSRLGKKALIGYFDPGVSKQLKQMALDQDSNIQELLREAINDLFQKHKKPTIA